MIHYQTKHHGNNILIVLWVYLYLQIILWDLLQLLVVKPEWALSLNRIKQVHPLFTRIFTDLNSIWFNVGEQLLDSHTLWLHSLPLIVVVMRVLKSTIKLWENIGTKETCREDPSQFESHSTTCHCPNRWKI